MSKIWATIKKNLKVLLRDRVAAFTVLIAPLLIVLLVGFAYSSSGTARLLVGVDNATPPQYVDHVQAEDSFEVVRVSSSSLCNERIKRGIFDACVTVTEANTTTVNITVDETRTEIARTVRSTMRRQLSKASSEERRLIVEQRYQNLTTLQRVISDQIEDTKTIMSSVGDAKNIVSNIASIEAVSSDSEDTDSIHDAIDDVRDETSTIESSLSDLQATANNYTDSDVSNASSSLASFASLTDRADSAQDTLDDTTVDSVIDTLEDEAESLSQALNEQSQAVNTANDRLNEAQEKADAIQNTLDDLQTSITAVQSELISVKDGLNRLANPDVEEVANPLQTTISRVGESRFSFGKTTPYLVGIETFLFALLLGGAIAFNQNRGSAASREVLAPIGATTRVLAGVATGLAISLVQTMLTAGAAIGHLQIWSVNIPIVLSFLALTSLMSLVLGVILGQIFKTMQGLLLGALATGTVFISFSNFVSPLEEFHPVAAQIGEYNPFTVAVDSLRKSMFFDTTFQDVMFEVTLLSGFVIGLLALAILLQYRWKQDRTEQQRSELVEARLRLKHVSSGHGLVAWLDNVSYGTYRSLRDDVSTVLSDLDVDVSVPWFRKGRLASAVQSSSSMSSMSSSDSKSSSSSSSSDSDSSSDASSSDDADELSSEP
jgi:archaellum component FlaC/ABC-type polysaccharide/polyol phosphate export permease